MLLILALLSLFTLTWIKARHSTKTLWKASQTIQPNSTSPSRRSGLTSSLKISLLQCHQNIKRCSWKKNVRFSPNYSFLVRAGNVTCRNSFSTKISRFLHLWVRVENFTAVRSPNSHPYLRNKFHFQTKSQRQMTSSLMVQPWSMHCRPKCLRLLQIMQLLTFAKD